MIRRAESKDLLQIQAVLNDPGNLDKLEAYPDSDVLAAIANTEAWVFVWEDGGLWGGFCWVNRTDNGLKIEEFGAAQPGRGIGTQLLKAVIEELEPLIKAEGLWLRVASDNASAIRFYERMGFETGSLSPRRWHRRKGPVADALAMVYAAKSPAEHHPLRVD